jgi:hypothetical protein
MEDNGTEPKLRRYLIQYARGRGGRQMSEIVRERSGPYRDLAKSMDKIGWRHLWRE